MHSLRTATQKDLEFLFNVSTTAMMPLRLTANPDLVVDLKKEFEDYAKNFVPEKINVVQFNGVDVGRLRVVRSPEKIYIGGIQLLPEYQGKGIGSLVFADLVKESDDTQIPIKLEVSKQNPVAQKFYKKFGFIEVGEEGTNLKLEYLPK